MKVRHEIWLHGRGKVYTESLIIREEEILTDVGKFRYSEIELIKPAFVATPIQQPDQITE